MNGKNPSWSQTLWPWMELRGIQLEPTILNHGPIDPWVRELTGTHPFFTWWWLEQGSVTLTSHGKKTVVPARHWVLIPVGMTRTHSFSTDAVLISINFAARWPNGLPLLRPPDLVVGQAKGKGTLVQAAAKVQRMAKTRFGVPFISVEQRRLTLAGRMRLSSALHDFVARLLEQTVVQEVARCAATTGDARLDVVLDQLMRFLRAGPLPYAAWKQLTSLSRVQLDRLAQAKLGLSLRHHRDDLLFAEIHRRLSIDRSSIKRHALELGFVDSAHFCRWVRQRSGLTPKKLALGHA